MITAIHSCSRFCTQAEWADLAGTTVNEVLVEFRTYDPRVIRDSSLALAEHLGYPTNSSLPLVDAGLRVRSRDDVAHRMLCLDALVAAACGFPRKKALAWLERQHAASYLAESEIAFFRGQGDAVVVKHRVESLWALAWCVCLVPELDFSLPCSDNLVTLVPDIESEEAAVAFTQALRLRNEDAIIAKCDLAYCLHWAIQNSLTNRQRAPGKLHPIYVIERRRALEWLLSDSDWDHVLMDT